jgi:hypothetical protein
MTGTVRVADGEQKDVVTNFGDSRENMKVVSFEIKVRSDEIQGSMRSPAVIV